MTCAKPPLQVLLGESNSVRVREACERLGWGRMWCFRKINLVDSERWGFDTGIFASWDRVSAMRPGEWDGDKYMRRLERAHALGSPLLAVCPDLIAAGEASLEFSLSWRPRLPSDWPIYLAVQDGMSIELVAPVADGFTGIFMGGTDRFKNTAPEWCAWAHARGMRFHYGRCSTPKRLMWCHAFGADSVDSSQPLWSWPAFEKFQRTHLHPHPDMFP
jgi:hypothetical protein